MFVSNKEPDFHLTRDEHSPEAKAREAERPRGGAEDVSEAPEDHCCCLAVT